MPTAYLPSRRTEFYADEDGVLSVLKDASSILPYTLDWAEWLAGDTISTSTWTANGVTITTSSATTTAATAVVQYTNGSITNKIVTAAGYTAYRVLRIYGKRPWTTW